MEIVPAKPYLINKGYVVKKPIYSVLLPFWQIYTLIFGVVVAVIGIKGEYFFAGVLTTLEVMLSIWVLCLGIWEKPRKVLVVSYYDGNDNFLIH